MHKYIFVILVSYDNWRLCMCKCVYICVCVYVCECTCVCVKSVSHYKKKTTRGDSEKRGYDAIFYRGLEEGRGSRVLETKINCVKSRSPPPPLPPKGKLGWLVVSHLMASNTQYSRTFILEY